MLTIHETFVSNALLQCLRTWKEQAGEAPLILSWEDIDQLYEWSDNLYAKVDMLRQCANGLDEAEKPCKRKVNEN